MARKKTLALIMVISLVLAGGCKQLSRIEDNQLELHRALAASAKHLATSLVRVEENQSRMSAAIEQLQTGVNRTANNIATFQQGEEKLHAAIENVQAGTNQNAAGLAAARDERKTFQAALGESLRTSKDDLTASIAKIEAGQGALQAGIADLKSDVKKVSGSADGLRQDMAQLRSTLGGLQAGTENVAGIIDIVGQKQLKFEEKILTDIRAIGGAVDAIQQRQAKLAEQVGGVQNNTDQMRESMIAVLKQLRSELSRISSELGSAKPGEAGASVSEVKE
jgi:chromosome segregation ATPase